MCQGIIIICNVSIITIFPILKIFILQIQGSINDSSSESESEENSYQQLLASIESKKQSQPKAKGKCCNVRDKRYTAFEVTLIKKFFDLHFTSHTSIICYLKGLFSLFSSKARIFHGKSISVSISFLSICYHRNYQGFYKEVKVKTNSK